MRVIKREGNILPAGGIAKKRRENWLVPLNGLSSRALLGYVLGSGTSESVRTSQSREHMESLRASSLPAYSHWRSFEYLLFCNSSLAIVRFKFDLIFLYIKYNYTVSVL